MKFYYTGLQHTHDGQEIPFATLAFDTKDEYLDKYHAEMKYAMDAVDILDGLTVIVFDSTGAIVLQDHWMRTVDGQEIPISPIVDQS